MGSVIVLGAKGRFGRAAVDAFCCAGWHVTELARQWSDTRDDTRRVAVDILDQAALSEVCEGCDVIVNALNPPYPEWAETVPLMTASVLAAARAHGATVMIPGNVYTYGADMPPVLTEETPARANTKKGRIRMRMEDAYRDSGVATIILRGGDFLEAARTGNWFDTYVAAKAWDGKMTYPGPLDVEHTWAYLPDMARAMTALADKRAGFDSFEEFGFEGYALTGAALVQTVEEITGKKMRVSTVPWPFVGLMGLFSAQMREVLEMRYLWNVPHRIDATKFKAAVPEFQATPLARAIAACLAPHAPMAL